MATTPGIWRRFVEDCRDLWCLIRYGQPKDDPLDVYRFMADVAKAGYVEEDLDEWEGMMFAKGNSAFWFDPKRYDHTPWAWPRRDVIKSMEAQVAALTQQHSFADLQNPYLSQLAKQHYANNLQQSASYQSQLQGYANGMSYGNRLLGRIF